MAKPKPSPKSLQKLVGAQPKSPARPVAAAPMAQPASAVRKEMTTTATGTTFDIIRLHFHAPLHLSDARPNDYGNSQRVVHSDALMAAICQAWAMLGKPDWIPGKLVDAHGKTIGAETPGFTLSSLFPFHGGKIADPEKGVTDIDPIYFLPKPYFQNNAEPRANNPEPGEAKKFKKVQYVDTEFFSAFLKQTTPPDTTTDTIKGAYRSQKLTKLTEEQAEFIASDVVPRIVKPRDESEPEPFYMERVYFRHNSGLWAIVQYDDGVDKAATKARLSAALNYLADNGIGTDRAVGNGQFEWEYCTLPIALPTTGQYAVNLSLFCPNNPDSLKAMLDTDASRYDLIRRGGWLSEPHNTYRKRSVWMFREGGLMKLDSRTPTSAGRTMDLQPDILADQHPVWRSGRALFLPVNLPE